MLELVRFDLGTRYVTRRMERGLWAGGEVGNVRTRSTGFRVDLGTRYVTVCVLQEGVGGSFQQYFYNRSKIVVYTELRSDSIKNHAFRNEARRIAAMRIIFTRISCTLFTCDMYMCRLRHVNVPVLSSLKMEGVRSLFLVRN
jgi:hypothetical protein